MRQQEDAAQELSRLRKERTRVLGYPGYQLMKPLDENFRQIAFERAAAVSALMVARDFLAAIQHDPHTNERAKEIATRAQVAIEDEALDQHLGYYAALETVLSAACLLVRNKGVARLEAEQQLLGAVQRLDKTQVRQRTFGAYINDLEANCRWLSKRLKECETQLEKKGDAT